MKRVAMTIALVALALAGILRAEGEPIKLKGLMGIGVGSMPGLVPSQSSLLGPLVANIVNEPEAVVFRYWISEKIAWEGQLALDYSSQPNSTTETTSNRAFGIGTAFKWNFKRPTETTLAQLLVGLSYAALAQGPDSNGVNTTTSTVSLFVGPGFEAFLPFWRSLSVEGSIRLRLISTQTKSDQAGQAAQSSSSLGFVGDGFTPLSLALNYYF